MVEINGHTIYAADQQHQAPVLFFFLSFLVLSFSMSSIQIFLFNLPFDNFNDSANLI